MLAHCEDEGLASINRSPLAMGLLTGKFDAASRVPRSDIRGDPPQWLKYFRDGQPAPEWLERLAAVRDVLTGGGRSLAAGALGWILARSDKTIPIPGFRTVAQVEDNLSPLAGGPLEPDEMREIARTLA